MKYFILCISLWFSTMVHSQEQFSITEDGLTPKAITVQTAESDMYNKALQWIYLYKKKYDMVLVDAIENETIQFTSVDSNAVSVDSQYFSAKYSITLNLTENTYTFEPTAIDVQLNSKNDRSWQAFYRNSDAKYNKKEKVIRKDKAYIHPVVAILNELYMEMGSYLIKD